MPIHILLVFQTLIVIGSANTAPLILKRFLGEYLARPIDGGLVLADGRPLLGRSKTWRGLAGAVFLATLGAVVVGLPWQAGALAGAAAMLGDCLSSFTKRRMGLQPSQMALGIDQVPESLLAAVTCGGTVRPKFYTAPGGFGGDMPLLILLRKVLATLDRARRENRPYWFALTVPMSPPKPPGAV